MAALQDFARRLAREHPSIDVRLEKGGLVLTRGRTEVRLGKERVVSLPPSERRQRRQAGDSYVDPEAGSIFVDQPGLLLHVEIGRALPPRLTPFQCALVAAILTKEGPSWFESGLQTSQVDLAARMKLELGVTVSPMAMSRFLEALRRRGILVGTKRPSWKTRRALSALRADFRLSAVGRAHAHAGTPTEVEERLRSRLGPRFALGVAEVLTRETGAWIEPRDYLVEEGALDELGDLPVVVRERPRWKQTKHSGSESLFGPGERESADAVIVRVASRVPLGLLTLGSGMLQSILGVVEALRSKSPVAKEAAGRAWKGYEAKWK